MRSKSSTASLGPLSGSPMRYQTKKGVKRDVTKETQRTHAVFHDHLYAPSGFDIMKILVRVATRPNPQIDLGPVDCSAAITVCDTAAKDTPIVYCSEGFTDLTGYPEGETLGRNCRFLQTAPEDRQSLRTQAHDTSSDIGESGYSEFNRDSSNGDPAPEVRLVDQQVALKRLRSAVVRKEETQAIIRNYTKSGIPFDNLVTVIPVRWTSDSDDSRYMVGFQAKPDMSGDG